MWRRLVFLYRDISSRTGQSDAWMGEKILAFCPEHPNWDQNVQFTSETSSIPFAFIWESPFRGHFICNLVFFRIFHFVFSFYMAFIIKFRYNARSNWLKQRALSECRCTEWPVTPFCARWQAENLSCTRLQAMKKRFLAIKSQFLYKCEQSYIIKQLKKPKSCFVLW